MLFWFILAANLLGAFYGFVFYYGGQFLATNPLLWIFIPDCPLAALLFGMAFLSRGGSFNTSILNPFSKGKKYDLGWLWFLAFVMALKYGFWTVFVLLTYQPFYLTAQNAPLYWMLVGSHIFLMFETILMVGKIKPKVWYLIPALGFLLANDLSDYLLGTHPPLPDQALGFIFPATIFMTVAFTTIAWFSLKDMGRKIATEKRQ